MKQELPDDTLVMAEWYDLFIPPRHHMAVTTLHQLKMIVMVSQTAGFYVLNPSELKHEQAEAQRQR